MNGCAEKIANHTEHLEALAERDDLNASIYAEALLEIKNKES